MYLGREGVIIGTTASILLWVGIGIAAIAIDLITSNLLFVWFTIGCLASLIALILNYSFTIQVITFVAVSVLFMGTGYPLAKETLKSVSKTLTMEEGYIGREITIDDEVIEKTMIKLDGIYWTIKNQGDIIEKGDKAKIVGIEGNKLLVKKIS